MFIHGIIFADDVDALVGKDFVHLIDLVRRQFVFFHEVHDFCIGQAAFLLPHLSMTLLDVLQARAWRSFALNGFFIAASFFLGRLYGASFSSSFFSLLSYHLSFYSPWCTGSFLLLKTIVSFHR